MNIHEHLQRAADASDPQGPDLSRLARVARLQGTRARRRTNGLAVLGTAAVVGAVAFGTTTLMAPDPGQSGNAPVAGGGTATPTASASASSTPAAEPTLDPSETGPFTGRGAVAALRHSVKQVTRGHAGAFAGQGDNEVYAQLEWSDADRRGISVIGVNIQPGLDYSTPCSEFLLHCTRTRSADGSVLTTYDEHTRVPGGVGIRRTAALLRADDTRVVLSETNGFDLPKNGWKVTRPQPPLSFAQLRKVVRQPWWGAELPTYFLDQGELLKPYQDLG